MSEEKKDVQPCTTQGGTCYGYVPEYKNNDGIWKRIDSVLHTEKQKICLVQRHSDPIYFMMDCYPYEVAQCFAWQWLARCKYPRCVRVVPYKLTYDVKAYREEDSVIEVNELDLFRAEPRLETSADK